MYRVRAKPCVHRCESPSEFGGARDRCVEFVAQARALLPELVVDVRRRGRGRGGYRIALFMGEVTSITHEDRQNVTRISPVREAMPGAGDGISNYCGLGPRLRKATKNSRDDNSFSAHKQNAHAWHTEIAQECPYCCAVLRQ